VGAKERSRGKGSDPAHRTEAAGGAVGAVAWEAGTRGWMEGRGKGASEGERPGSEAGEKVAGGGRDVKGEQGQPWRLSLRVGRGRRAGEDRLMRRGKRTGRERICREWREEHESWRVPSSRGGRPAGAGVLASRPEGGGAVAGAPARKDTRGTSPLESVPEERHGAESTRRVAASTRAMLTE